MPLRTVAVFLAALAAICAGCGPLLGVGAIATIGVAGASGHGGRTPSTPAVAPLQTSVVLAVAVGVRGHAVDVPVTLHVTPADDPSTISFDVVFPAATLAFEGVTAGPSASAASKNVLGELSQPGRVTVVIAGLNAASLATGAVANLRFSVMGNAGSGQAPLVVENLAIARPSGAQLAPVLGVNGRIIVP